MRPNGSSGKETKEAMTARPRAECEPDVSAPAAKELRIAQAMHHAMMIQYSTSKRNIIVRGFGTRVSKAPAINRAVALNTTSKAAITMRRTPYSNQSAPRVLSFADRAVAGGMKTSQEHCFSHYRIQPRRMCDKQR